MAQTKIIFLSMFAFTAFTIYRIKKKSSVVINKPDSSTQLCEISSVENSADSTQLCEISSVEKSTDSTQSHRIVNKPISFLPPQKKYIYKYNGTIENLNIKLKSNSIKFREPMTQNIYECYWENLRFEIRLTLHTNFYNVEFKLISGCHKKLVDLIKRFIN